MMNNASAVMMRANKMALKKTTRKRKVKSVVHHKEPKDYLVTGVLIASALAILVLISSFISVTGQAVSGTPDTIGVTTVLQEAELLSGTGTMKCSYACARSGKSVMISSLDSEIVGNDAVITGDWTCLCGSLG